MNWFSRRLSDSAWARILAVYVLMLIGGVVGLRIGGVVGWGPSLFAFPFVTVLMGPFVIGVWIGMLLFGHGSGTLGPMFSLVLLGLQYVLLVVAFRLFVFSSFCLSRGGRCRSRGRTRGGGGGRGLGEVCRLRRPSVRTERGPCVRADRLRWHGPVRYV